MKPENKFYFYNSSIGDLSRLIKRYHVVEQTETPGYITNAFGVKIRPEFFPDILKGKSGVEPLPIPANWHADMAEFGAALRSVELAENEFTVVELGCGWGCWLNITGVVAKRKGLKDNLIGVEGDKGHVEFAQKAMVDNNFDSSEYSIHRGIASSQAGSALFPIQTKSGESWGLEPVFNAPQALINKLVASGSHEKLNQIPLSSLLGNKKRIDLLHIDIQGGEIPLIPDTIDFLDEKVATILIGTHSRSIEGEIFNILTGKGWRLEVERPAILSIGKSIDTLVDGVQFWRNPRFISDEKAYLVDTKGSVRVLHNPKSVNAGSEFDIEVEISNRSKTDWASDIDCPVRLSYHWMHDEQLVEFEGLRTPFTANLIGFDSQLKQSMRVIAPALKGSLTLVVTMVQDGIRWFDSTSFINDSININIK